MLDTALLKEFQQPFLLSTDMIKHIAVQFRKAMYAGLCGKTSPLKMLPSFLAAPTGQEKGAYMALDFGGTNIRALLVELYGNGHYAVIRQRHTPLKTSSYDYTADSVSAEELFDFIASEIGQIAPAAALSLGHTFSFPSYQTNINNAKLITWTKELKTTGVENANITQLLSEALIRRGLAHIRPAAVINDTAGTLLTAAYSNPAADIGSICGTGHNTAYLEPWYHSTPMIINMESGNFDKLPLTIFDAKLDTNSEKPGQQLLEKSVSGRYLGELLRLIINAMIKNGLLPAIEAKRLNIPDAVTTKDLSLLMADSVIDLTTVLTLYERTSLQQIAALLQKRSAQLTAATFYGILCHIDPKLERRHHIAIDGSLYEKMPGYAQTIQATLTDLCGKSMTSLSTGLIKNGSGIGAAIAAAMAKK